MASVIEKKALETADLIGEKLGYFVVGAEYKREAQEKYLRIYIDKTGGVGINECEEFSRAFEAEFDKLDAIDEAYILEVSSPGVDRILKTQREFDYYAGREVEIKLYKAIDKRKEFVAVLEKSDGENVFLKCDGEQLIIPIKETVYIRLYFEF